MRRIFAIALMMLFGVSSAWTNDAAPDLLKARYEYVACDVEYAGDWLAMREDCGVEAEVDVFDSSPFMEDLEEDLDELEDAADEGDQLDFGLTMIKIAGDSLELIGAVITDALDSKNSAFFECVREGEAPLMDEQADCRSDALETMEDAAREYLDNELEYAESQVDEMDALGADTSGMEDVVDQGRDLEEDIEGAFASGDPQDVQRLHLRHSRLVMLFRMEKMLAVIDYARPIVEAGSNENKEEILDEADELKEDIEDYLVACEYEEDVGSVGEYSRDNAECWGDALVLYNDFNSIQLLILDGA